MNVEEHYMSTTAEVVATYDDIGRKIVSSKTQSLSVMRILMSPFFNQLNVLL